jgi:hypothetical protein
MFHFLTLHLVGRAHLSNAYLTGDELKTTLALRSQVYTATSVNAVNVQQTIGPHHQDET